MHDANVSDIPSERTVQELAKSKAKIQELAKVNASWEKYSHDLKTDYEKQITSITQELSKLRIELDETKKKIAEYQDLDKQREKGVDAINRQAEGKIKSAEEQKDTAVKVAMQQSNKVDELKAALISEKENREKLEEKIRYLEKAVQTLRTENSSLRDQLRKMNRAPGLHDEREKKIKDMETEIMVLKQQVQVFKTDFDTERGDREKAQAEINTLEVELLNTRKELKAAKTQLDYKDRENEALREANRELQRNLDDKEIHLLEIERQLQREKEKNREPKYNVHIHQQREYSPKRAPSPKIPAVNLLLSEEQKRKLRKNWTLFMENMTVDDLVPKLYAEGVLSMSEKQQIDAKQTSFDKAEYLMSNVIIRGTQKDLRLFKSALIDSYQQHIADILPVPAPATSRAYQYEEPMDIPPQAPPTTWVCSDCTYKNHEYRTSCEICGKQRRNVLKQPEYMMSRGIDQCDNRVNGLGDVEED